MTALNRKTIARAGLAVALSFALSPAFAADRLPKPLQGAWRGEFAVGNDTLPFNFEIDGKTLDDAKLVLLNEPRRDEFKLEARGNGDYAVPFRTFDAELDLHVQDGKLVGTYHYLQTEKQKYDLAFTAEKGATYRFVKDTKENGGANYAGRWKLDGGDAGHVQIAELHQQGNRVHGVILDSTGDSRALQGNVVDGELRLSGFTGPTPKLIRAKIDADGKLAANNISARGAKPFGAVHDDNAELPNAYALTKPTTDAPVQFTFPDANGNPVSLGDPRFKGKVVAIQLFGTWCPNCTDEAHFLAPWYAKNKARGVEVVGIAFEQEDDAKLAEKTLPRFAEFNRVDYPLVFGGGLDKTSASQKLPWLSQVFSYPTLVLLDKRGQVREIHTGFSSAETGKEYQEFVAHFNATIDKLLAEPDPKG